MISTVISPKADLNDMLEYFKTDEVLSDKHIIMNPLTDTGLKARVDYKESFHLVRKYEYFKYLLYILNKIDRRYVSELVIRSQQNTERMYRSLQMHTVLSDCTCPGGPCIPGAKKLFVTTAGSFFPCEKISESAACGQIRNIQTGFNLDNIKAILNIAALTENECKNCWAFLFCKICAAQIECKDGQKKFDKKDKLIACQKAKSSAASDLYEACVLHEFGYRPNEKEIVL